MACKKITKTNGSESELITTLESIYENEFKAEAGYSYFESDVFISEFGDYIKGYEEGDPSFSGRVDNNGEPKLHYNEAAKKYYFINEKKEEVFYPLIKRGLRATFNYKQIDKIVSRLALNYFKKSNLNFNNIKFEEGEKLPNLKDDIRLELVTKINELKNGNFKGKFSAKLLESSLENLDEYVERVDAFYKQIGIKRVDNNDQSSLESEAEEGKDPSFTKQSFEKDIKDSLTTNIKLKLALLEDTNDLDPIWGEPTFIGYNEAHGTLLNNITNQVAVEGEDLFELQRDAITLLATKKPYLKQLLSYMKEFTEEDKNQFAQAFNLHGNNYLVSEIQTKTKVTDPVTGEASVKKGFTHVVKQISESGSKATLVTSEWGNNFKNSFLDDKNKLTTESKEILSKIIEDLDTLKTNIKNDLTPSEFEKFTNEYISLTRKLGVEMSENGIINFLDNGGEIAFDISAQINKLSTSVTQTAIAVKKAITTFKKVNESYKNPFDTESVFKKLAKAEAFYLSEGSESSIYSRGKNQWLFSYPSYLSTRILQWKKNPELLRNWYNQSAYNKGSEIMKYLLALDLDQNRTYEDNYVEDLIKERLENFKLGIFNSFQETGNDKNQQQSATDLSFKDYFTDNVNKVLLNSYVRTTTPADKGSDLQIKTGFFIESANFQDGILNLTAKTKEVFFNYFNSEVNRMKEASNEVDTLKFTPEKLIINYHYKEGSTIDAKDGNAFQSQYFPELSFNSKSKNELVLSIKDQLYNLDGSIKHTADISANPELKQLIISHLNNVLSEGINQTLNTFLEQEILEINGEGLLSNKAIDQVTFTEYSKKNLLNSENAALEIVSDYYINSLIQNVEYSKMFTGDVAFYKNMIDYKKRVPATYTDGLQLRLKKGEEHFTVATIDKVEIGSPYHKELVEMLGVEGAKPYSEGKINSADAQAWITPKRWKFLVERLGKWTSDHDSLYTKMMSDGDQSYTAKELKIAAQPLKGVYFYMNGKTPTYLKYSQAVLTPNMLKNSPGLRSIYSQMDKQGVDELITLDGFKTGSPRPTRVHNVEGTVKSEISFNTEQLSNYGWKLQQDLPVKLFKQTDVGSQIQKNIFAGLIHNLELAGFNLDGSETNGQTISDNIVNIVSGLVDKGILDIKEEFDVFRNGEIKNIKGFYKALVSELEKRGGSKNIIDALNKQTALYGMPQSMDKIVSVFSSIMNDRLIKIKTNGGSFIQMSNFGISKEEGDSKGILWNPDIENGGTTYEPRIYTKENGRKSIKPAGILISGSFIAKYIPDYKTKYTTEELFKGKDGNPPIIDKKILENLVGYRIPNQGLSSNDALEIIGILPEENGDTVVAYTGITTKTGSDFDIDKMYLMMSNYSLEGDRLVYTEYDSSLSNKKQSKEALQNRLIELYKSVLTHPKVIKDVMTPLDNDVLKDDIVDLIPSESSGTMFHFDAFNDIKLRYEFINGKAGVGQEANAVVDVNRPGNLSINKYNIGWGHVNEKGDTKLDNEYSEALSEQDLNYYKDVLVDIKIKELEKKQMYVNNDVREKIKKEVSNYVNNAVKKIKVGDSLTAILNAFVDIAKDPYITRGNWTTSTTNTGNLLIRAGVHPLYVTSFMAQPIIKEYIEYQASKESIITKNTGDIKNKFKKNLAVKNLEKLNDKHPELLKPLELIYQKFAKSNGAINPFTASNAAERLQKMLGKKNTLSGEELENVLTTLKREHDRVFNAEKLNITDRKIYDLQHYREQIKNEASADFQIAILDKFYELQTVSKVVKENVDISKLDTNGMGKNVNSLFSTFNLIKHVLDKEKTDRVGVLNGLESKFENTTLAVYHKGLKEILRIVQANPLLFPQADNKVQTMFNEISNDLYDTPAIDKDLVNDLEKEYYTYVMSNFTPFNLSSVEIRNLLSELPVEFENFKKTNKGKYVVIDELLNKFDKNFKLITLNNRKKSSSFEEKFTDSWRDLITDHPEFAENLIKYSFLTSGFQMNTNQFFTYIPHEYLLQNNINQFIVNFSRQDQFDFLDKFYLNNTDNYKYVPKVFDSEIQSEDLTSGFTLKQSDKSETGKARYYVSRDAGGGIYKLEGYDSFNRAIYTRIKALGQKRKGSTIVEYGDQFTKSNLETSPEYITRLKNSVVTERDKYNPNFTLDKIADREEDDSTNGLTIEEPTQPSTGTEVATEPITSMSEITNHSGGAYGADTFWDQIGREFGVTKHMHYRESANSNLSQKLRNAKVEATVITKEELEAARTEVEKLLGIKFSDTLEGNLQVRNYYQVANSDGVFAIARLSKDFMNAEVFGGTNTAVQLGQKLNKPVYVWDTETEQWYKAENKKWVKTETPILTKNFAGVGSRDIESYSVKDKETGSWKPRKEYLGTAKENAAKQAIRDVYQQTKDSIVNKENVKVKPEVKLNYKEATNEFIQSLREKGYTTEHGNFRIGLSDKVFKRAFDLQNQNINIDDIFNQSEPFYVLKRIALSADTRGNFERGARYYLVDTKNKGIFKISSKKQIGDLTSLYKVNLQEHVKPYAEKESFNSKVERIPFYQSLKDAVDNFKNPVEENILETKPEVETKPVTEVVQTEIKSGQYVKYNGETYIVTKQNANGTFQILNPNLEGPKSKISVSKEKLQAIGKEAKLVTYKGVEYLVTPNNTIISTVTNKAMNWAENDGNRRAILELANNNIKSSDKIEIPTVEKTVVSKPQEVTIFKPANKEQEVAIEAIKDFIENGNPKEIFTLEGKAGTGKTTLVQEALADSVEKGKNIHIAALSHKAKLVLAQKLEQRFPKKISSSSIAGLLGMKMNEETGEFETGFSEFERPVESADIIVIDEASMVNEEALSLIMSEKRYGTKVIFLGDRGQLPPIRKLSSDEISTVFESSNKASLVERVRQGEESPILPFADYFWDNSESDKPKANPIPEGQIKDSLTSKGNLVFVNNLFDVFEDVVSSFKQGIDSGNFNIIKIVTYKNATRQNYNKQIRKSIFGEDVPQFVVKDQIMFQNNYMSQGVEFSNSDEFSIEAVITSEKNGYKVFDIGVKVDPTKDIITYFSVLAEEDKSKFNEEVARLFEVAKKMAPGQLRKMAYKSAWALKATFAEIDYSYAITSHKSQGSTYDNVIVDLKDIYSVGATTNASKSRSAYTGLTRAKNTAIIITSKAETNSDNVKKALNTIPQTTLTKEEQTKAEELKKYCNPS